MADYKGRGADERMHVFRHESPGKWKHYSRPVWEKFSIEREEDNRDWTLDQVKAWLAAQSVAEEPVTEAEIDWVKEKIKTGYNGVTSEEPEYPKDRQNFICDNCGKPFLIKDRTIWGTKSICKGCRSSSGLMWGRGSH